MSKLSHKLLLFILLIGIASCRHESDPREIELDCTESIRFPLYYGANESINPAMRKQQIMAIGSLKNEEDKTLCTGTLITSNWVLTASHCDIDELKWFETGYDDSNLVKTKIVRGVHHIVDDIMLLKLQPNDSLNELTIEPLRLWHGTETNQWIGIVVTMVGMGTNEEGENGKRRFIFEPIVQVTEKTILVDGEGMSGACHGDSGGPLLIQNEDGEVELIGVLKGGSSSCVEVDIYTRTDMSIEWIESVTSSTITNPCGSFTPEGRCVFDDLAIYCDNGRLSYDDCLGGSY